MDNKAPWYTRMTDDNWATAIKIAAVMVAVPRWIGALLEADGAPLLLTEQTRYLWGAFSALASAGMALVEGVAFWYTLRAWRKYGGGWLFALIVASMATFAVVLTPYIMANVSGKQLADILQDGWLIAWSSCVSLSTILIVASVGYAQPKAQTDKPQEVASQPQPAENGLQSVDTTGKTSVSSQQPVEVALEPSIESTMPNNHSTDGLESTQSDPARHSVQTDTAGIESTPSAIPPVLTGDRKADIVAYLRWNGPASKAQVADYLSISRQGVKPWIDKLVAEGAISDNGHVALVDNANDSM